MDFTELMNWIQENVIGVIALTVGLIVMFVAGYKGNLSKGATMFVGLVLGLLVVGIAVTPAARESIGAWLAGLLGIGGV